MKLFITILLVLCFNIQTKWMRHQYSAEGSQVIANAIKNKIIANKDKFTNKTFINEFLKDLDESNDSKRKVKQIDTVSAGQLFAIFQITDPKCDKDGDNVIKGSELKCLNIIWKTYVP